MEFEIRLVRWSALRIQKIEVVPTPIPYPSIPFFRFVVRTEGQQFFVHSFRRAKKEKSLSMIAHFQTKTITFHIIQFSHFLVN